MIKKIGEQTIIEFGTGDINIIPGILIQEKIGILGFREQKPRKIGLNNGDKAPDSTNAFEILMQFNKIESIDVLIHALNETKEMMERRERIINTVGTPETRKHFR